MYTDAKRLAGLRCFRMPFRMMLLIVLCSVLLLRHGKTETLGEVAGAAPRPNIVLLMCDDLGYGDLTIYNPESRIRTPALERLAADGLTFTRFYAAAPVCSPTRGSCLTGRHPFRYGIYSANVGHLPEQEATLPEYLAKEGYATGHFGKWHLGTLTKTVRDSNRGGRGEHFSPPRLHGYQDSLVTEAKVPTYDPMVKPPQGGNLGWEYLKPGDPRVPFGTAYWDHQGKAVRDNLEGDDSRIVMDRAIVFMEKAVQKQQPFFAAIWFHAPHLPVVAGPEQVQQYSNEDLYTRNYYGCLSAMDQQIGRLRKKLEQLEISDNTWIWFCSDNGPEGRADKAPGSAGMLRGRKRSLYEGGIRSPGIVVWPGKIPAGTRSSIPAVTSDYLPTILAALELQAIDQRPIDGISLWPTLLSPTQSKREDGIGFQSGGQAAWIENQYKIYRPRKNQEWELYDLQQDAGEKQNLADQLPAILQQRIETFDEWQRSCANSDQGNDYSKPIDPNRN